MPAPKHNDNARKDVEVATSHLHIRITPKRKAIYVRAARGQKLSDWVTETLDRAAKI